jgi:hypothetical protein
MIYLIILQYSRKKKRDRMIEYEGIVDYEQLRKEKRER